MADLVTPVLVSTVMLIQILCSVALFLDDVLPNDPRSTIPMVLAIGFIVFVFM